MTLPAISPALVAAREERELLKSSVAKYEAEKDALLFNVKPCLEARYLMLVGQNQLVLFRLKTERYRLRFRLDLIQRSINLGEEVNLPVIDMLVDVEMEQKIAEVEQLAKEIAKASEFVKLKELPEEDTKELRRIYHKLARMLHPDINPAVGEQALALWHKVTEAYSTGDLEEMKMLEAIADNMNVNVESFGYEDLISENKRLAAYASTLLQKIEAIRNAFPFTHERLMEDKEWVMQENNRLLAEISALQEQKAQLEAMTSILLADKP